MDTETQPRTQLETTQPESKISGVGLNIPFDVAWNCRPEIYFSGDPEYMPRRSSPEAAGYDLRARIPEVVRIPPHHRALVPTGVFIAMPAGVYGKIEDRSGWANREGLKVLGGVIDSDYRKEISVILLNTDANSTIEIHPGVYMAQIIFQLHAVPTFVSCEKLPDVQGNQRLSVEERA